jgi:hypothetical protein
VPRISASNFVTFAKASARGKQRLVTRAIANGKWPGYRPRDDYWVRMRNALKRLLRSGDFTTGAIAREVGLFPSSRQAEAAAILTPFAAGWPALRAEVIPGDRLLVDLSGFTISCLPHATVRLGQRRLALRFTYGHAPQLSGDEKMHLELLRLALGKSGVIPGVLQVRGPNIHVPRRNPALVATVRAEARFLMSLWQANGGPM